MRSGARRCGLGALTVAVAALVYPAVMGAAQCGSALLLETAAPAVFDGVDPAVPLAARFWAAGAAGSHGSDDGCRAGCTPLSGAPCAGGGDCLALTGVSWLNADCATPGHLPARTVFLIEQATAGSGGRWAALSFDANPGDANTDLDAKSSAVCGGCASVVSPYLGSDGRPVVVASSVSGGMLTATLTWSPPPAAAQALSNAPELVSSYSVFYRLHAAGPPPPATGDPTGWSRAADLEPDGTANGGFSTDTGAQVEVTVPAGFETATFAVGLNLDGSGDPDTDPDTVAASYLSDQSDPVAASSLIFTDGFESGDVTAWSAAAP